MINTCSFQTISRCSALLKGSGFGEMPFVFGCEHSEKNNHNNSNNHSNFVIVLSYLLVAPFRVFDLDKRQTLSQCPVKGNISKGWQYTAE